MDHLKRGSHLIDMELHDYGIRDVPISNTRYTIWTSILYIAQFVSQKVVIQFRYKILYNIIIIIIVIKYAQQGLVILFVHDDTFFMLTS